MKKLLLILLAGYFLTLFGCPTKETEPDTPDTEEYTITGEVHMFNSCNEDGIAEQQVKVSIDLYSEGDEGERVTTSQTITLTPSSDDPDINVGSYNLSVDWDESKAPPTKWDALIITSVSGASPCTQYECINAELECIYYPLNYPTEVIGKTTVRDDYYLNCFCPE